MSYGSVSQLERVPVPRAGGPSNPLQRCADRTASGRLIPLEENGSEVDCVHWLERTPHPDLDAAHWTDA